MEYVWVTGTCGTEQKKSPAISPELTGVKRRPRASPTGRPAPSLRPNQPSRAASRLWRGMRECSRAGAFGGGSLTLLDRFHHGRVRFMRHADPSAALGSMEPANTKRSGEPTGVPEPVLSSTATWDCWRGRPTFVGKARSGPDNGQTNRWREPGSHPSSLKRRNGVQFTNRE